MQTDPRGMQMDPRGMQMDPRGMQMDPRGMQMDIRGMQMDSPEPYKYSNLQDESLLHIQASKPQDLPAGRIRIVGNILPCKDSVKT
ncbi:hypothetical protein NDU88_001708 [Pleurodeles waltl]|uniref:Uncharacterized protein n=1 Tax=Pleurodeles waltl TaxID=8319 RepID=A0AAV7M3X5_PLEWA|nr:hypothetical protein NDU88_001708 [Pleurodeles waltl]